MEIDQNLQKRLKVIIIIAVLLSGPLILLAILNTPFKHYFSSEELESLKNEMMDFTSSYQNPSTGLFIEPDIDSNFRAINSFNFSTFDFSSVNLINPNSNPNLDDNEADFFFHYLFEKQNDDGSFSDIVGLGNTISTFQVIDTINQLDPSFIDPVIDEYEIKKIKSYLTISQGDFGWGFKFNPILNDSDIISTYCGIKLAKKFSADSILNNQNMSRFINSTWRLGGYVYTNNTLIETSESTYYGIKAFFEMNMNYSIFEKSAIYAYLFSLRNVNGGYADVVLGESTVQATYFVLSSLYTLGYTPLQRIETLKFVLNCNKTDGGFGLTSDENVNSDFKSGWAAMKAIELIEEHTNLASDIKERVKEVKDNYYNWLYSNQGANGLFGQISIETNYLGVLATYNAKPAEFSNMININNTWEFVEDCYNPEDGGFGSQPNTNSSLFSTYCAINLYQIIHSYYEISFPNLSATKQYLIDLQNPDGGFKVGMDIEQISTLYGELFYFVSDLIKTNISTVESTYWAIASLHILGARDQINNTALFHWISACQNADGGFPIFLGFSHSDVISTYYGLQTLKILNIEPLSRISVIEFLKNAQLSDGSFTVIPGLSGFVDISTPFFMITYLAAKALYDYNYQPEEITQLIDWFLDCFNTRTGGIGDSPSFGGDLRNTPYGIIIIEELRHDQSLNPVPWSQFLFIIFIIELSFFGLIGIFRLISLLNLSKRIKIMLKIGEKLNIAYLQKYPAIYCEDLNIYAGRKLIVDSVTIRLEHGEILGVLGESGAGKSTFVKALLGMRKFTGINRVYGMNVKRKSKKMRPIYGYVPQDLSKIYPDFTTLQNLLYFGNQYGLSEKEIRRKAKRILRALEIEDKMNELVSSLSGGQKRRVSMAIGLVHDPVILFLDEHSSGLDPVVRENLMNSLLRINEQLNQTIIIITHYPEESRFCNKVAIFARKRGLINYGRPKDLLSQLPGKGRTINLVFKEIQDNPIERLESIEDIDKALETKAGTNYSLYSDLTLNEIIDKIENEFGIDSIQETNQSDSRMEEYFRYRAMEVPEG